MSNDELRAALIERAEQERRQDDADRMVAAHQRHGDAGEAEAAGEVQDQPMLHAQDLVEATSPASAPEIVIARMTRAGEMPP